MNNLFQLSEKSIENPEEQEELRCRVCYDNTKPLISVCGCSGSIGFVHEDCVLDWITRKIETADRVEIPYCEICNTQFSARMKVGKKKLSPKLLLDKITNLPILDLIVFIIHSLVAALVLISLLTSLFSVFNIRDQFSSATDTLVLIFTRFICPPYAILFYVKLVQERKWIVNECMVQVVEIALKPIVVIKK